MGELQMPFMNCDEQALERHIRAPIATSQRSRTVRRPGKVRLRGALWGD